MSDVFVVTRREGIDFVEAFDDSFHELPVLTLWRPGRFWRVDESVRFNLQFKGFLAVKCF